MSIKHKRALFALFLVVASIWNCCCLLGWIAFEAWPFSFALAAVAALTALIPLLFPSFARADEKSRHYSQLKPQEKLFSGVTLAFCLVWLITALACVVYPL